MKKLYSLKSLLVAAAFTLTGFNAFGQTKTITITTTTIGGTAVLGSSNYNSGAERVWSQDEVSFGGKAITGNNNNTPSGSAAGSLIQAQANNGVIYNTTALPGKIVSITLNYAGTANNFTLTAGNDTRLVNSTTGNYSVTGTAVGSASSTGWTSADFATTDYKFFAIKKSTGVSYISSIVIEYEDVVLCTNPVIETQPTSATVAPGAAASFHVGAVAGNETLTYQWQAYDEVEATWEDIVFNGSELTSTFSIPVTEEWMDGSKFRVVVSAGTCSTISNEVTLTLDPTLAVGTSTKGAANLVKNTLVDTHILFNAKAVVKVVNANGQVVKSASVNENTSLDVASLPKGIYVVTAVVNGKTVSQKIVKK